MKLFLKWLGLSALFLPTPTALALNMADWTKYAEAIAVCAPSYFNLPDPMKNFSGKPDVISYQINGWKGKVCDVTITREFTMVDRSSEKVVLNCQFQPNHLAYLAKAARNLPHTNSQPLNDPTAELTSHFCQALPQANSSPTRAPGSQPSLM